MATAGNILEILESVLSRHPDFHVGIASEKKPEYMHSWIVDVYEHGGEDVIFQVRSTQEDQPEVRMTVRDLHQRMAPFSSRGDSLTVEMDEEGRDSKEQWRFHVPIVGAQLFEEKQHLIFKNWDRMSPRPSIAKRAWQGLSSFFSYFRP